MKKPVLKKPVYYYLILALLVGVFIFAAWQVAAYYIEKHESDDIIDDASRFVTIPEGNGSTEGGSSSQPECPIVNFEELKNLNSDVVAWIYGANTHINYPVVQGRDNDYYLRRLLDGTWNDNGSIFMDYTNKADFSDQNTLIYGHNMKSGAMFSNLVKYKQQAYYNEHPYLYIVTPQKSYKMHLFAGVIVSASGYILDGSGEVTYSDCSVYQLRVTQEFLQQMANHSTFRADVAVPSAEDAHIVTLSTCTYEFTNVRYVVLGYLEELNGTP